MNGQLVGGRGLWRDRWVVHEQLVGHGWVVGGRDWWMAGRQLVGTVSVLDVAGPKRQWRQRLGLAGQQLG